MFTFQTVGWSALFYAVTGGYLEITRQLITAEADILLKDKVLCCIILFNITKMFLVYTRLLILQKLNTLMILTYGSLIPIKISFMNLIFQ